MKLKEIGEFGFIDRFASKFKPLIKPGDIGIGDDCAIISVNPHENQVVTTDLLVEDIHFLKQKIEPEHLGHKALAVNLSDIAAMGATPQASFLSIAMPQDTDIAWLDSFMQGYHSLSQQYQVPLMGGDTTKSQQHLAINVVVTGLLDKTKARLRCMAQTGDIVCVTGTIGDSAAGLQVLLDNLAQTALTKRLVAAHHLPQPQIKQGQWLAEQSSVHAMMDISDGIASDLQHILDASKKSAKVELNQLPISNDLVAAARTYGWNRYRLAAGGGEDYQLLITVRSDAMKQLNTGFIEVFNSPLYPIGTIHPGPGKITWQKKGHKIKNLIEGFNHFK
ncbi:MAG: thiamine-phosphate kinase [Gammaproteobacteria bacterium]|nr:MAG: thiamine-phosphate kinase [Gammaproteobacteria bacterium]